MEHFADDLQRGDEEIVAYDCDSEKHEKDAHEVRDESAGERETFLFAAAAAGEELTAGTHGSTYRVLTGDGIGQECSRGRHPVITLEDSSFVAVVEVVRA